MRQHPSIRTVRIEIEPDKVVQGRGWIQQAISNGFQVVATYHKCAVLGSDDVNELSLAAAWWVQNYKYLHSAGDFTVNFMNEWGSHSQTAASFASAYNDAVSTLRTVYQGPVIIDIPGWGQETYTAAQASPLLTDTSIILSAHVYPSGWNGGLGRNLQPADMDELHTTGRPCLLGEFGFAGSGPVDVAAIVNRAKALGFVGCYAWAWNGDGGDANMCTPAWSRSPFSSAYAEGPYFNSVYSLL